MGDETVKIFLNTDGTTDDIREELRAFLDYVAGKKPKDPYVEKLEDAVKEAVFKPHSIPLKPISTECGCTLGAVCQPFLIWLGTGPKTAV